MTDILHTDAPIMPLTQMVGGTGRVIPGEAAGHRRDCFYGWGEAMADALHCKPHTLVTSTDDVLLQIIAEDLVTAGWQAVITDREEWSKNQRSLAYDDDHQH